MGPNDVALTQVGDTGVTFVKRFDILARRKHRAAAAVPLKSVWLKWRVGDSGTRQRVSF